MKASAFTRYDPQKIIFNLRILFATTTIFLRMLCKRSTTDDDRRFTVDDQSRLRPT